MPTLEKSIDKPAPIKLEYHPTIHDMPTDERPRERLKHYGPQALANAELLAIILRTGTTRDNVVELASKLLTKYGGLSGLMRAELGELCAEYGLGEAKAAQLKAALEIGRRLGRLQPDEKYQIKSPADAANLVIKKLQFCHQTVKPKMYLCRTSFPHTLRQATHKSRCLCATDRYEARTYSRKSDAAKALTPVVPES